MNEKSVGPSARLRRDLLAGLNPTDLGQRLAGARRARNLSQADVARHLDVSRPTLVAIEKGTRPVRLSELQVLADLFGCSVHELVRLRTFVADFAPQFRLTQVGEVAPETVRKAVEDFQRICE